MFHRRDRRARPRARAVPHVRPRSVSGRERRPDLLDSGRLHDDERLPVLDASTHDIGRSVNYIRNSVKIVIDAYNGIDVVLSGGAGRSARADPRRASSPACSTRSRRCRRICGGTSGTRKTSSDVQARIYATYHMTNPLVFYNKEDQWQVPVLDSGQNSRRRCSRTTRSCGCRARRRPSSSRCCRSRRAPRTTSPRGWWRAATRQHYGQLLVFQFPKQKIVYGPRQIIGRINQDQVISPQITLWNQQGSQVIWGTLLVIPIDESLLYVRPLYLRSPQSTHPRTEARHRRRTRDQIVMAETLTQALAQIFGREVLAGLPPDRQDQRRPDDDDPERATAAGRGAGAGHGACRRRSRRSSRRWRRLTTAATRR